MSEKFRYIRPKLVDNVVGKMVFTKMAQEACKSDLAKYGDLVLVWVNESDLHNFGTLVRDMEEVVRTQSTAAP